MTTEERLARLERNNRWLTLALVLAGLAAMMFGPAYMQLPKAVSKKVTAGRFVLVDDNGKKRAVLEVGKDGPSLTLNDDNGKNLVRAGGRKERVGSHAVG